MDADYKVEGRALMSACIGGWSLLEPGELVSVIGTGEGAMSREASRLGCSVISWDADPRCEAADVLGAVVPPTWDQPTVTVHLGTDPEVTTITTRPSWHEVSGEVVVPAVSIDLAVGPAAVVLMDIEGAEADVLPAWQPAPTVRSLLVEWHTHIVGDQLSVAEAAMPALGWELVLACPSYAVPIHDWTGGEWRMYRR